MAEISPSKQTQTHQQPQSKIHICFAISIAFKPTQLSLSSCAYYSNSFRGISCHRPICFSTVKATQFYFKKWRIKAKDLCGGKSCLFITSYVLNQAFSIRSVAFFFSLPLAFFNCDFDNGWCCCGPPRKIPKTIDWRKEF